jgi:hypothetical protein
MGLMEDIMTWMPIEWVRHPPGEKSSSSGIPTGLRAASTVLRTVFIVSLLMVILRVSTPQNETIWTAYETPGDLIRVALGFVVCIWLAVQLFRGPKDAHGHRTWLYLGLVAVPFALFCVFAIW